MPPSSTVHMTWRSAWHQICDIRVAIACGIRGWQILGWHDWTSSCSIYLARVQLRQNGWNMLMLDFTTYWTSQPTPTVVTPTACDFSPEQRWCSEQLAKTLCSVPILRNELNATPLYIQYENHTLLTVQSSHENQALLSFRQAEWYVRTGWLFQAECHTKKVTIKKRSHTRKSRKSTPFLRDRSWNFAHVLCEYEPCQLVNERGVFLIKLSPLFVESGPSSSRKPFLPSISTDHGFAEVCRPRLAIRGAPGKYRDEPVKRRGSLDDCLHLDEKV